MEEEDILRIIKAHNMINIIKIKIKILTKD